MSIMDISIHALLAESDLGADTLRDHADISIHALLAESDIAALHFLSQIRHFYPRSPCGERPLKGSLERAVLIISIHALLAESDWTKSRQNYGIRYFYPRSPCGERQRLCGRPLSH